MAVRYAGRDGTAQFSCYVFVWRFYNIFLLYLSCDVRSFVGYNFFCTLICFKAGGLFISACRIAIIIIIIINVPDSVFLSRLAHFYTCWQQFRGLRFSASLISYKRCEDLQITSATVLHLQYFTYCTSLTLLHLQCFTYSTSPTVLHLQYCTCSTPGIRTPIFESAPWITGWVFNNNWLSI